MAKAQDSDPIRSVKDIVVRPIATRVTSEEMELRKRVMDFVVAARKPYPVNGDPDEKALISLARRDVLRIDEEDGVVCVYPVSAYETNKKVIFEDGRYGYAMCALDAIGFHYAFGEDVVIEGECEYCGSRIVVSVSGGKARVLEGGDVYVTHTDLEKRKNWSCCCCNAMHFFDCKGNLERWQAETQASGETFPVSLETANKIAWLLFSP
ncbi:MAG: organomercurial lyase [Gordonibacter sp.]|uniref:organomercurial lyase n=1 Tax=Gordonibacter sp. TaxID=1968902 RepID=UPI002FC87DCE